MKDIFTSTHEQRKPTVSDASRIFEESSQLCEEYKRLIQRRKDRGFIPYGFETEIKFAELLGNLLGRQSVFMAWKEWAYNNCTNLSRQLLNEKIDKALKEIEEALQ